YSTDKDYADVINTTQNHATIAVLSETGELISLTASEGVHYVSAASAPDGTVVVVGQTLGDMTEIGPYVAKLNADGEELWSVSGIPWSHNLSGAWDVAIDSAGNIDVVGTIGEFQNYVAQLNVHGDLNWFTSVNNNNHIESITTTRDDGIVAVGRSTRDGDVSGETTNNLVMKFSSEGKQIWRVAAGDPGFNEFKGVAAFKDGVVVVGVANRFDGDYPESDKFDGIIAAYDGAGNQLWERSYSGNGANRFQGVTVGANADFYVRGLSQSSEGDITSPHSANPPYGGVFVAHMGTDGSLSDVEHFGGSSEVTLVQISSTGTAVVFVGYSSMTGGSLPPTCGETDALIIYRPVI
ncbi:MAG: hypothetical protein FWD55_04485, partial [Propionibacteriaceae bacterium]|nr:hypothetical protein [Propionibacteriaceae bacterium]